MANDWYRKTTWSEADQGGFFAHLKRSRTAYNQAQYLRIQANDLEGVSSHEMPKAALELLEKMFAEFPEQTPLACAYRQKASCLAKLGNSGDAIAIYHRTLQTERELPRAKTYTFIDFGKLVVENKLARFYDPALSALEAELNSGGIQFPADTFNAFGIRLLIAAPRGQNREAKELAKVALEAAAKVDSGLRYHPTVGLVRNQETPFDQSIQTIAFN